MTGNTGPESFRGDAGRDTIRAGSGDDRISAVDGQRDSVSCGQGFDVVRADRLDRLSGCERVNGR
jgi:hypothetical protein